MDAEISPTGQYYESGSWHPARRPDSNIANNTGNVDMYPEISDTYPPLSGTEISAILQQSQATQSGAASLEQSPEGLIHRVATNLSAQRPRHTEIEAGGDLSLDSRDTQQEIDSKKDELPSRNGEDVANAQKSNVAMVDLSNDPSQSSQSVEISNAFDIHLTDQHALGGIATYAPEPKTLPNLPNGKEEMDTAWRLEAEHASLSEQAPGINRGNSFPDGPLRQPINLPAQPLPQSQVGNIMDEAEHAGYAEIFDDLSSQNHTTEASLQDPLVATVDPDEGDFFANPVESQPSNLPSLAYDEARFEEGLPLVPTASLQRSSTTAESQPERADVDNSGGFEDDDEEFFDRSANPVDDSRDVRPQTLDRKNTTQVLESMQYAPHDITHTAPETDAERPSLADLAGGGISVSTSTTISQASGDQKEDAEESESKDEDLAEMWKAALGDDDLLGDNETLDPSSFFEDDGEGFLEDSHNNRPDVNAFSPPLEPVHGPDGKMQGFGRADKSQGYSQDTYTPPTAFQTQSNGPTASRSGQLAGTPLQQSSQPTYGLSHSNSVPVGFAQQPFSANAHLSRPQMPPSTQSFANKSKGGYTSPYDLPMDVARPKKRSQLQQSGLTSGKQNVPFRPPPPPPRSSSMFASAPPLRESPPPVPSLPRVGSNPANNTFSAKPSSGSFFEELPSSSKARPSTSSGRFVKPAMQQPQTLPMPPQRDLQQSSIEKQPIPSTPMSQQDYQLLPPEKLSLYGNSHQQQSPSQTRPVPAINSRYSPAPLPQSNVPPPRSRYALSSSGQTRPPSSHALAFQPRTSSPLTQGSQFGLTLEPPQGQSIVNGQHAPNIADAASPSFPFPGHQYQNGTVSNLERTDSMAGMANSPHAREPSPPMHPFLYGPLSDTPSASSQAIDTPEADHFSSNGSLGNRQSQEPLMDSFEPRTHDPPRRAQTQSPGTARSRQVPLLSSQTSYPRPASVNEHSSLMTTGPHDSIASQHPTHRGQAFSQDLSYIRPSDGRELDHLERWKGCPVFRFGFGGVMVTSFPRKIPRYAAGKTIPMIKCSPGEVKLEDNKFFSLEENMATFPGPLKSKSKKKDVQDWLQKRITYLETSFVPDAHSGILSNPGKRREERILLWKIVKVLVDHDGVAEGSPTAEKAVRDILSPELSQGDAGSQPQDFNNVSITGTLKRDGSLNPIGSASPVAVEQLRKILLHGEREKAVWHAVDNDLWAHAMLISSTLDRNIWRQVSQEFIRQEVKTFGENTKPLSALYQIFAGNWEDSVDELVPPSARAGLQMVSKTANAGPTKNALDGLDRWQETLTLILSNRSPDDSNALVALGRLLAGYGRTEAAHICYVFAKSPGLFGGPDDPQVTVALLGADHHQQPFDYGRDFDSVLLTEVYDFALTVLAPSSIATFSPHLQCYKLYHAMTLAEYGYKSEALQYCDAVASALKSTTKPSPYYHSLLFGALDTLNTRLRQAPRDISGSWISKPSIDKVSGSIWAKFNSYVAGDENDAASTGSNNVPDPAAGPFARVTGDSPNLSRTPSSSELYSSYPSGLGVSQMAPMATPSNSRYTPGGLYTPQSSLEQPSQDHSTPAGHDSLRPAYAPQPYSSRPASSNGPYNEGYHPIPQMAPHAPRTESYLPTPPSQPEYTPEPPPDESSASLYQQESYESTYQPSYQPSPRLKPIPSHEQQEPLPDPESTGGYEPSSSSYEPPPQSSYEPPHTSNYEPPSYSPPFYDPNVPQAVPPVEEKSKKKSFIDDDDDEDDFEAKAAARRKQEKARKDREADEVFRKAAEADTQKDKAPKLNSKKSGWFSGVGGWLGGSKKEADIGTPNAPIRAKLGEASSFYYDEQQKKWVNKNAPQSDTLTAATPPPPKGPPSRAVSASGPPPPSTAGVPPVPPLPTSPPGINITKPPISNPPSSRPPSGFPSRTASPRVHIPNPDGSVENSTLLALGNGSGPPSAPPSRPATGQSGASSIDELIGAPQARKGGTVRKVKKGRGYVDVMASQGGS